MNRKAIYLILASVVLALWSSCGEEGGVTPPCINCDFWTQAFGGSGRLPSVSPVDPSLIAFCSTRDTSGLDTYYHIWVVKLTQTASDTNWFYQITADPYHDFNPAWSPDGNKIAFQRSVGPGDRWQIYVVDVSDLSNPGTPEAVTDVVTATDTLTIPYSNKCPSWVSLAGETWIAFCNSPKGGADSDIGMVHYPDLDSLVWVTIDPSDFANNQEGGVLSFTFEDYQEYSNGSNKIVFASPSRKKVGDLRVVAKSEEQPDTVEAADIFINGKDSGKRTPYTFRYRPAGDVVEISGLLEGYCSEAVGSVELEPDTLNVFVLDFVHTHGTLGVRSDPGGYDVFINGEKQKERTSVDPQEYIYFACMVPDTYVVETRDIYGTLCGVDSSVVIQPGDTTLVTFVCGGTPLKTTTARSERPKSSAESNSRLNKHLSSSLASSVGYGLWLIDLGSETGISDDRIYLLDTSPYTIQYPVLSPDGRFVAYAEGQGSTWNIVVVDISQVGSGGTLPRYVVGLPGSSEDIECWREVEKVSWIMEPGKIKIVASLSPCRGGLPEDLRVWVADVTEILE